MEKSGGFRLLGARVIGVVLAVVCVLLVSGQPAAAQPRIDVGSVISRLEREQVVRLPGAVTSVDAGRLTAQDRVVLAPAATLPHDLGPLWAWANREDLRLTVVEGWWISQQGEPVRIERETLPWLLASGDVTALVVGAAVPVPHRVTAANALPEGLRVDEFDDGVRLVTLPVRPDPVTGYATALATRFPGEMVVVAHGAWLEFAGDALVAGHYADEAEDARDATYGLMLLRRGSTLGSDTTDLVTAVLDREAGPESRPLYAPEEDMDWDRVYFGLAVVIAAVGWWLLSRHSRAADVGPMRMAWAKANLRVQQLEAQLAGTPDPDTDQRRAKTVKPGGVRTNLRPVGKRNRRKGSREVGRGPVAPEPTARPRGRASLAVGVHLAGLTAFCIWKLALEVDPADQDEYTPQNAAQQLRYSSVYVYPLSIIRSSLAAEEAQSIVGDRPLVAVAGFPDMCPEIAKELPDVIVVVVSPIPDTPVVDCAHENSFHDAAVLRDVRDAITYLETRDDRTAHLTEYVRAFDTRHPSPRRASSDTGDLADDLIPVGSLLVVLGLTTFGAIALHRTWHTTNTRLNRLAVLITHANTSRPPHERAAIASEYVHALRAFETAATKEQRATTAQRLATLEKSIEQSGTS